MFNRFIVATDLCPASFAMVHCLGNLKEYGARHCLLLQCLSAQEVDSVFYAYDTKILNSILIRQREILKNQGFSVETRIVSGDTRQQLNQIATRENYSLFVVGTREYSLAGETFLGGIANDVMHHACIPVLRLLVEMRTGGNEQACGSYSFNGHILFPTDFSEHSAQAFLFVEKLVADGAKRVTLFHVQKTRKNQLPEVQANEADDPDLHRLMEMRERLLRYGKAEVFVEIRAGSPSPEILRLIQEHEVQLVVMAPHSRNRLEELFVGSVSRAVARHAEAGVLFIPPMENRQKTWFHCH